MNKTQHLRRRVARMRHGICALTILVVAQVGAAQVAPTATITGTVTDASGTPMPGVEVTAEGAPADPFKPSAVTDDKGSYRLDDSPRCRTGGEP